MTQEAELLEAGHRAGKSVYDQNNDEASSSSRKFSAKNSAKKNFNKPLTKIQQADRKIDQSNKSAIRKTPGSSKAEAVPIVNRDRKNRNKVGELKKPIVGNQNERVGATGDGIADQDNVSAEMTVISQQNSGGLRETISSEVIDNAKNLPATDTGAGERTHADEGVNFLASEATPTAINTDLQSDGAAGGMGPTNENSNIRATEKTDSDQGHSEVLPETDTTTNCIDSEKDSKDSISTAKEGSCLVPLPKTDDPIARLNALRANISNALKEVKAVLDQHGPPSPLERSEGKDAEADQESCVKFRFVRRAPKKNVIKFEDEEIICNVPSSEQPKIETHGAFESGIVTDPTIIPNMDTNAEQPQSNTINKQQNNLRESEGNDSSALSEFLNAKEKPAQQPSPKLQKKEIKRNENTECNVSATQIEESKVSKNSQSHEISTKPEEIFKIKVVDESNQNFEVKILNTASPTSTVKESSANSMQDSKDNYNADSISKTESKAKNKTEIPISNKSPTAKKKQIAKQKSDAFSSSNESIKQDEPITTKLMKKDTKIPQVKKANQKHNDGEGDNAINTGNDDSKRPKLVKTMPIGPSNIEATDTKPPNEAKSTSELVNKQEEEAKSAETSVKSAKEHDDISNSLKIKETLISKVKPVQDNETKSSNSSELITAPILESTLNEDLKTVEVSNAKPNNPSETQNFPTKLPKKKPVEKCASVEKAALEILNRKRSSNSFSEQMDSSSPSTPSVDRVPEKDAQFESQIKSETTQKSHHPETKIPKITNSSKSLNMAKNTDKPATQEKLAPQKLSGNDRKVDEPATIGEGLSSKPPFNLRVKRASFTEPSKEPPKSKIAKPKRASIGSESELLKIASGHLLPEKDATEIFSQEKSQKVTITRKGDKVDAKSDIANASLDELSSGGGDVPTTANKTLSSVDGMTPFNGSATILKSSLSSASKIESLAEIAPTPSQSANASITQAIPIESNDGAKIAPALGQDTPVLGSQHISSSDKLVSSKSAELSGPNSVGESSSKMTVVKKDKVASISPKQPLEDLNDKLKQSEIIKDTLDCNLNVLPNLSVESLCQVESLLQANDNKSLEVSENGEVPSSDVAKPLRLQKVSSVAKVKKVKVPATNDVNLRPGESKKSTSKAIESSRPDVGQKEDQRISSASDKPVTKQDKAIIPNTANDDMKSVDVVAFAPQISTVSQLSATSDEKKQDDEVPSNIPKTATSEADATTVETQIPEEAQQNEHFTSTTTESSQSEAEKDGTSAPPKAKKTRKMKKVIIRRVKRKLSRDGSLEEKVEPEVCEKPIEELIPAAEEVIEEPAVEEPPVPKGPKSCLVRRSYEPGQKVLYADRVKKSVKWKQAKVIEKITDISYKLEFDGVEKPAHISYIKKFTDKKVQFGGKEYLEIDYQQEYESSEEEEPYNIWARV